MHTYIETSKELTMEGKFTLTFFSSEKVPVFNDYLKTCHNFYFSLPLTHSQTAKKLIYAFSLYSKLEKLIGVAILTLRI